MGGSLVALSGVAGAATVTTATISATTKALGNWVGTTQLAGTITIKLPAAGTFNTKTITLTATNTPATGTVVFSTAKATSSGALITKTAVSHPTGVAGVGTAAITIHVNTKATGTPATITVYDVRYTTDAALDHSKKVVVTPTSAGVTFNPTSVSNATYPSPGPTTPAHILLAATTTRPVPPVAEGVNGQTASSWALIITGAATHGITAGAHVKITIQPHTGVANCPATNAIAFDGTPKVSVTTAGTTGTTLAATKIKVSAGVLSGNNGCTGFFAPNVFTVDFTSTVKFGKTGGKVTVLITTVKYSVAPKTTAGTVDVSDTYFHNGSTGIGQNATTGQGTVVTSTNAIVSHAFAQVKTLKSIAPTAYDQPIGTISVVESVAGSVPKGYVCVTFHGSTRTTTGTGDHGNSGITNHATGWSTAVPPSGSTGVEFNTSAKPTVKVASGNGTATTAAFVTTGLKAYTLSFEVTAASSTASTYTLSGLAVNGNDHTKAMPLITVYYDSTATCGAATGAPTDHVAVAFTTTRLVSEEIYGTTAAGTAAAELEHRFSADGTYYSCPVVTFTLGTDYLGRTERPVIVATDSTYPDALASQYLAGQLDTGTLLTSPTSLPAVTINALRAEGISHVYVVGGPLAVSTTVVAQIETIPVYRCGGTGLARNHTNQTGFIQVTRIWGPTQYDTAQKIDEFISSTRVDYGGGVKLAGAYSGGPTGHGAYNDTTGIGSTKVVSGGYLKTAIVSSGAEYQDAEAASVLAYSTGLPIVLTTPTGLSPQAATTLQVLHIRQVIVMGGPLAVSNTVVKAIEALTITGHAVSVLRVAGKDYTDTAVQLAKMEVADTSTLGLGWSPDTLLIARGNGFTDGIAGAVVNSYGTSPLLLTENPTTVGTYLTTFLKVAGSGYDTTGTKVSFLIILGGPLAVTPSTIAQMQTDL
jgi:putative cell wall-binding protein